MIRFEIQNFTQDCLANGFLLWLCSAADRGLDCNALSALYCFDREKGLRELNEKWFDLLVGFMPVS